MLLYSAKIFTSNCFRWLLTAPSIPKAPNQRSRTCADFDSGRGFWDQKEIWNGILIFVHFSAFAMRSAKYLNCFCKGDSLPKRKWVNWNCWDDRLDWEMGIANQEDYIGTSKTLQGNLAQLLFMAIHDSSQTSWQTIWWWVKGTRHIANLGHGVYPWPVDSSDGLKVFIETVKNINN